MVYFNMIYDFCKSINVDFTIDMYNKLYIYMEELISYNNKINLTSITDKEEIIHRHFIDSISLLKYPIKNNCTLCDVGTGAGFPGLPLKILRPDIRLTLVEATSKKVNFLHHITKILDINDIYIVNNRVENISHDPMYREKFDYVTSRAMARLNKLLELSFPLVKLNGEYISLKGNRAIEELDEANECIGVLGGIFKEIINIPKLNSNIIVIKKNKKTSDKYPRQYSIILKKTL